MKMLQIIRNKLFRFEHGITSVFSSVFNPFWNSHCERFNGIVWEKHFETSFSFAKLKNVTMRVGYSENIAFLEIITLYRNQ